MLQLARMVAKRHARRQFHNLANRGIQSGDRSRIRANLLGSLEWSAAFRLFAAGR
jgi:hypothetical protein